MGRKHTPESIQKMRKAAIGRKLSLETRTKISASLIGKPSRNAGHKWTDEHREKMVEANSGSKNPMYGRIQSEETRLKISEKAKGRVPSLEARKKMSVKAKINNHQENHWNWKGGITKSERAERKKFSETISPIVLKRDNYTCQVCEVIGGVLHADHIKSWSEYPELRFELSNCRTLCRSCHYYVTFKKSLPESSKWGLSFKPREIA